MRYLGLEMLFIINQRLKELKPENVNIPFGGVSIIIMGDFAQLPPVMDKPMFHSGKLNDNQRIGSLLYELFDKAVIFNQIMRQQGEEEAGFRDLLFKITKGTFNREDWQFMQSRDLLAMNEDDQK